MAIDVSKLGSTLPAQEEGIDVHIVDANGDPTEAIIRVAGPDSKRTKKAVARISQERVDLRIRRVNPERAERERNFMAGASIISWSGFVIDGKEFECNESNAIKLMAADPDIREQVEAVANNRANFTKT
jgi:hypothetical protein